MTPNDAPIQLRDLVDRMLKARNASTKTYMPAALLAMCDLAELGKVRDGIVQVADYKHAFKRLMLEVWPEREDWWFRPMLHVKKHGMWRPLLAGQEVPYSKSVSSLSESTAKRVADALRLDPVLRHALDDSNARALLRRMTYEGLERDVDPRSTKLSEIHQHLDPSVQDSELLRELVAYEHRMEDRDAFEDRRVWQVAPRVVRQGQATFRAALMAAYASRCCMSGADAPPALEAAHIHPFLGSHSNDVTNGLLLRGDLHTLFDNGLLTVDTASDTFVISVHSELNATVYRSMKGYPLTLPAHPEHHPRREALAWHSRKHRG